jgi:hypothetical protein
VSHVVGVTTEVRDPEAVAASCRRPGLPQPVPGTAQLFEGEATELLVRPSAGVGRGARAGPRPAIPAPAGVPGGRARP